MLGCKGLRLSLRNKWGTGENWGELGMADPISTMGGGGGTFKTSAGEVSL